MGSIEFRNIRAITFDCYGTLIDWETGLLGVLRPWAERENAKGLTDDALLEAFSQFEPMVESEMPTANYRNILRAVMPRVANHFRLHGTAADADRLATSVGDWPAFADTPGALARLKSRYRLVIVSNVDRASFAKTNEKLGVEFDAVITAEDVGSYKPSLGHFHRALETLTDWGIEQGSLLHAAQSLYHDIVPAQSLGIKTAWIDRRSGRTGSGATPSPMPEVVPDATYVTLAALADSAGV